MASLFVFKSPIREAETLEVNSTITKNVRYALSKRNYELTFYLKGYENKFVIKRSVLENVNSSKIKIAANDFRKVKIKILDPQHRSMIDKLTFYMYDKIDIIELEINNAKYLDLKTYNDSNYKNNIGISLLFGFFGIITIVILILERNYRTKKNK